MDVKNLLRISALKRVRAGFIAPLLGLVFTLGTLAANHVPSVHAAEELSVASCVGESVRANFRDAGVKTEYDRSHFPAHFTAKDKARLLAEFSNDGRPILVVTDADFSQKSGVATVMTVLRDEISRLTDGKVNIQYVMPDQFHPQLRLKYQDLMVSHMSQKDFEKILRATDPQAVHVMVEGTLGGAARKYLLAHDIPFTTAYHTMFPEFVAASVKDLPKLLAVELTHQTGRLITQAAKPFGEGAVAKTAAAMKSAEKGAEYLGDKVSLATAPLTRPLEEPVRKLVNANLVKFHSASEGVMVPTNTMAENMIQNGHDPAQIRYWSHGADTALFHPSKADPKVYAGLKRPISLFVGRVAAEKNIEDFLKMNVPGTKVVIGGGPDEEKLKRLFPDAVFLGRKDYAKELPAYFASADKFVFPSLTDTFGLVQLEAAASGTPVVAYKVQGPIDVITSPDAGRLAQYAKSEGDENVRRLEQAWHETDALDRTKVRAFAEDHTWERSALEFLWFLSRLPKAGTP